MKSSILIKEARRVLRVEADAVRALVPRIGKAFIAAVETLYACKGRVVVTGIGKSGTVGRKIMATLAAQDLAGRFPAYAPTFRNNLATYLTALDAADAHIHALLDPLEQRNIATMHDAWYYFATAYNLTITAGSDGQFVDAR